ncbi:unnamed protein product, partial [Thlaspi arvense]
MNVTMVRTNDSTGSSRKQPTRGSKAQQQQKGKSVAASSAHATEPNEEEEVYFSTAPWPRPDARPFVLSRLPNDITELWPVIGTGPFESREAKLTLIRNPVVRVVAKILGNIMFGKEESDALRKDELLMLHYGLPSFASSIYSLHHHRFFTRTLDICLLMSSGLTTSTSRTEAIGSLLTPIFRYHDIDLTSTERIDTPWLLNEEHFRASGILMPGYKYQFQDRDGRKLYCQLPNNDIITLSSRANLEFLPDAVHLCPNPTMASVSRRRGSSSRSSAHPPHYEDAPAPDTFPQDPFTASAARQSMKSLLPPYAGQYDLLPLAPDVSEADRWAWMVDSQRKNNSMMQRIWGALAKLSCPRPPSCFRATETRDDTAAEEPDMDADDEEQNYEDKLVVELISLLI